MKHIALALLLLLTASAQARIGETMGQATTRLGPATERIGENHDATYRWRKEKLQVEIRFRAGRSYMEEYCKLLSYNSYPSGFTEEERNRFLTTAGGPGKWRDGVAKNTLTNGVLLAREHKNGNHNNLGPDITLTIVSPPPKTLTAEQRKYISYDEELAEAQFKVNQLETAVVQKLNRIDADNAAGIHHLRGTIESKFREGLLIRCEKQSVFPGNVLLVGNPLEAQVVDGLTVANRVKVDGTFEYRSAIGSTHTIFKVRYVSEIPQTKIDEP